MTEPDVVALGEVVVKTFSPDRAAIQAAEAQLKTLSQQPSYGITVLKLVATDGADLAVRQAAGVLFKNYVKYRWAPSDAAAYGGVQAVPDVEKGQIKAFITGVMLRTPPLVRAQLSEALTIISKHEFPQQWPTLLDELVQNLNSSDLSVVSGVLDTANSIFKRYRNQYGADHLVNELGQCQKAFVTPCLETLQRLSAQLPTVQGDIPALKLLLSCVRLCCRIFFSLNSLGLTNVVEDQLAAWMEEFSRYLQYSNAALDEADPDKQGVLDAVKAAICSSLNLFMEYNEEEFEPYLPNFAAEVWKLVVTLSDKPGQDPLAMSAIKFLTSVSRGVHHKLYTQPGALQQICENIVLPNMRLRDTDQEMFDLNAVEYIRRDVEGGDSDTRRRAAADLVKSLVDKFPTEVTKICTGYVLSMLGEYAANPVAGWRAKDCAVYLVLALTVRGQTGATGATTTNPLVNIQEFYNQQILPELQSAAVNERPVLKADALKFVTMFRAHLAKPDIVAVFPALIRLLASEYVVVHSYAAIAIERFLSLRESGKLKLTPADIMQYLQPLLASLFAAFALPDSSENEYVMKCVMRMISFVGSDIAPIATTCLQKLAAMLLDVCKNPRNPGFNHYMFESVAALIKHGSAGKATSIDEFEAALFPAFQHVLQADVQEFHPYIFQIFAQLIELRAPPLPAIYLQIFPPLLSPTFWERSGNVPALVRLLQAYLTKAGAEVVAGRHLQGVLGVFQKLIASKAHDHEGFFVLNTIVECLPLAAFEQYLPTVWQLLFTRLQASRTPKFVRSFVVFLALLLVKQGPDVASTTMDKVQPQIIFMILEQVWLTSLGSVDGVDEEKLVAVASTKLLEWAPLQQQAGSTLRYQLRDALLKTMQGGGGDAAAGGGDDDADEEGIGYSAAYARLANASRPERPVLAEIADPRQYVQDSLTRLHLLTA